MRGKTERSSELPKTAQHTNSWARARALAQTPDALLPLHNRHPKVLLPHKRIKKLMNGRVREEMNRSWQNVSSGSLRVSIEWLDQKNQRVGAGGGKQGETWPGCARLEEALCSWLWGTTPWNHSYPLTLPQPLLALNSHCFLYHLLIILLTTPTVSSHYKTESHFQRSV